MATLKTIPTRLIAALLGAATFEPGEPTGGGGGGPSGSGNLPWEATYLRHGMPAWVIPTTYVYDYAWWVDFDLGSDGHTGTSRNQPMKTVFAALDAWRTLGGPGRSVIWMEPRQHKEYISQSNKGFSDLEPGGVANVTPTGVTHQLSPSAELHIRTELSESLQGNLCEWDGRVIPAAYSTNRNAGIPAQLCLEIPNVRIMDMRFTASAGNAIKFGTLSDARGTGKEISWNWVQRVHINHAHGDGVASARGNTATWGSSLLIHHCQAQFGAGGGNNTSGWKTATNRNGGLINSVLFKNSDDNTDFLGANNMRLANNVCWLAGWFWGDWDDGSGETPSSWTPFGEEFRVDSTGNGNGFKIGGGGTDHGTVCWGNLGYSNKTVGMTDNSGRAFEVYNNTMIANGTFGYAFRDESWLANNVAALNVNGPILDSRRSGSIGSAYQRKNSWSNTSDARRSDNFNLNLSAADFQTLQDGFAQYGVPAGQLAGVMGFTSPSDWAGISGWGGFSGGNIRGQIGAR